MKNQKCVYTGHQQKPGHHRGVFNRIPGPVSTKSQRFVCPGCAHHDSQSQNTSTEQCPWHGRSYPSCMVFFPKSCHSKSVRNNRRREAKEQHWRMDDHPVILKEDVQPVSVSKVFGQVVRILKNGSIRELIAHQHKWIGSDADVKEINAHQKAGQKQLDHAHHRHDRKLPFLGPPDQRQTKHCIPESPEHKAALLSFPETTQEILHVQASLGVLVCIFVFEIMVVDDQVKGKEQANYRNNIGKKRNSCQPLPGTFLHHVLGACSLEIGIGCNKGRAKCKQS